MENASKALIIAGAILLSILIIALGIYVFNMAKGVTDTKALNDIEIAQFNQQFTNYKGKIIGSGVKTLLDKVISNATVNKDSDERLPDVIYADIRNKNKDEKPIFREDIGLVGSSYEHWDNNDKNVYNMSKTDVLNIIGGEYQFENIVVSSESNKDYPFRFRIKSDSSNLGIQYINNLRAKIADKHYYKIAFVNDNNTGLISHIIIAY